MQTFINLDTRRANFVDGRFTGILNTVRGYAEQGYIPDYSSQRGRDDYMWDAMAASSLRHYFKLESNYNLINPFINQLPPAMRIMGFVDTSAITDDNKIAGLQAITGGLVPFTYWQGFGINSQSKNKAAAWAFIKYLLSYEAQITNVWGIGFSINNKARAERAEFSLFGGTLEDAPGLAGITVSDQQHQAFRELLEEYRALVEKLSDNINTFVLFDASLNDMIAPEVQHFYAGTRSAEEVARVLQNRIDLYLSE
jgi:ABC-type glycerol-3-phosphate transport system substrate-binding protein